MSKKQNEQNETDLLLQACLVVDEKTTIPRIELCKIQKKGEGRPANRIPLPGAIFDVSECGPWAVCDKIREQCEKADEYMRSVPQRNAFCEHLAHAYMVLCDYVTWFDRDWTLSKETGETMIRGSIDKIVAAGKAMGFNLDQYRSEDPEVK